VEVTFLGTGAPLNPKRATMGIFVTAPGCEPLLIDTCGGMELARQLAAAGRRLDDVTNVLLTHRHLDHAGGVGALLLARRPIVLHSCEDGLAGAAALMQAVFPEWSGAPAGSHALADGQTTGIGGFRVELVAMDHRVPTLAVRVSADGKTFAYSADGLPNEAMVAVARGADLFACDAMAATAQGEAVVERLIETMHPSAGQAAAIAARAEVGALALVHVARFGDGALMLEEATAAFRGELTLPDDLRSYAL
jgi:ribonuclease BN (tRNA processing enzyme)